MYCGSCLRDNALAAALLARGHDVVLTPVYTPTRTDERNVSQAQVFFGGISVFLEQQVPLFRHTPRVFDRIWDAPWVIRLATKRQIKVDPGSLGQMTVSMLKGEQGFRPRRSPSCSNGSAANAGSTSSTSPMPCCSAWRGRLRRELKTPICCTLQGRICSSTGSVTRTRRSRSRDPRCRRARGPVPAGQRALP